MNLFECVYWMAMQIPYLVCAIVIGILLGVIIGYFLIGAKLVFGWLYGRRGI